MIRNLLATTAIVALSTTGAMAQATPPAQDPAMTQQVPMAIQAEGHLASDIMGESVYSSVSDDAENIGSVNDMVISREGSIDAIVVGVGGFLGIGQKEVALDYELVEWAERDGDRWLVVETSEDALRELDKFERAAYRPMPADAQISETRPASREDLAAAPAEGQSSPASEQPAEMAGQQPSETRVEGEATVAQDGGSQDRLPESEGMAQMQSDQDGLLADDVMTSAIDRNELEPVGTTQVRAEELTGTTVYGANDEDVGEIGDVIVTAQGDIDALIVDVGGFLGIGEKEVAIALDNLNFMTDADGRIYLYTNFTREQLEAQPEFDETLYAEQRDEMRLMQ